VKLVCENEIKKLKERMPALNTFATDCFNMGS
jgi:hypothetical protein